ncbi:MAG: hypothetical protein PHG03_00430 [Bacilli bacterium]|nr:hypothetical protein [Bacilli bacterium]MDD4795011.1 hypothetical protein [Bacilli bacterium]
MKKMIQVAFILLMLFYIAYISLGSKFDFDEIKVPFIETKTISIEVPQEKIYLAINEKYELSATVTTSTNKDMSLTWISEDPEIVLLEDDIITGVNSGRTTVAVQTEDNKTKDIEVIVSDLITLPVVNSNKSFLPCNKYSKEEADLLDEILFNRIDEAGYKTRAGVVAAARFLLLEFPYTVKYFNENGRLNNHSGSPQVDGEGRYYHRGLYLHSSKFESITISMHGPATWGCNIWDNFISRYAPNGLTCSGFVTWTLINGGFDVGDSGAGDTYRDDDVGDLGENLKITKELMQSGKVKVGDIIGRDGHVAVIIGLDETNIYIAESLPTTVRVVTLTKYDGLLKSTNFTYIILMDHVYKSDGNYTEMW